NVSRVGGGGATYVSRGSSAGGAGGTSAAAICMRSMRPRKALILVSISFDFVMPGPRCARRGAREFRKLGKVSPSLSTAHGVLLNKESSIPQFAAGLHKLEKIAPLPQV